MMMEQEEIINDIKKKISDLSVDVLKALKERLNELPRTKEEFKDLKYRELAELASIFALFLSSDKLNEQTGKLLNSSKRLEQLNMVLIGLTIVLAVLAAPLILRTV